MTSPAPRPSRSKEKASARGEVDGDVLLGSRALLAVVARSLGSALDEVTLPQFRLMVVLSSRGPMRSGDLAEATGVHASTLSRTAERLVKGGWVERVTNPDSRREILLGLSPRGAQLVTEVTARRSREISAILKRLSPREQKEVRAAFAAFARAAGEVASGDLLLLAVVEDDTR